MKVNKGRGWGQRMWIQKFPYVSVENFHVVKVMAKKTNKVFNIIVKD